MKLRLTGTAQECLTAVVLLDDIPGFHVTAVSWPRRSRRNPGTVFCHVEAAFDHRASRAAAEVAAAYLAKYTARLQAVTASLAATGIPAQVMPTVREVRAARYADELVVTQ